LTALQKQLSELEKEIKESEKLNEHSKIKFCEEIKKAKFQEIKNTIHVEEKYTIWYRMKKVLGMI
jgi:hypothetical protein